jgi:hypothetical protein
MAELTVPRMDFSSLGDLPQIYRDANQQAKREMTLANLGRAIADGTVDYTKAAGDMIAAGNAPLGLQFLQMGAQARGSDDFMRGIESLYGGSPGRQAAAARQAPVASAPNRVYGNDEASPLDPPSGIDRDRVIRTVVAEAGNQGPVGMQSVAGVIRNRAVNGGFGGNTPSGVVTAPNQFEPWNTAEGRARMEAIDPNSAQYRQAASALDRAYTGDDPTGGATHFYAPKAQAALGRAAPSWDDGTGRDIGDHRFFGGVPQDGATDMSARARDVATDANKATFLIRAISSPNVTAGQKEAAKMLLAEAIKVNPEIQKLESFRRDPGLMQLAIDLKRAGATNVNVNTGENEYAKTLAKEDAQRFTEYQKAGRNAVSTMGSLNRMESIVKSTDFYSGVGAESVALPLRQLNVMLGGDPKKAASMEDFRALSSKAALDGMGGSLGTGFSNADRDFIVNQYPSLANTPEGNMLRIDGLRKIEQRKIDIARLARDYAKRNNGRIDAGFDDELARWAEANPIFPRPAQSAPAQSGTSQYGVGWRIVQ